MNPNSPEDRLLDELLHEQSHGPDEAFLKQIEAAVDAGPIRVAKRSAFHRYGRIAIAAGLAIAAGGFLWSSFQNRHPKAIAVTGGGKDTADNEAKAALELQELHKAIRDQEDKVEERRKVLATIVRTKGIIHGQSGVDGDQGARAALQTFNELEQEKMQLESQISSLLKYDNEQLMVYAAGLNLPDNVIKNLLPQYKEAKRTLETLKINGMGDSHPSVLAARDQIQTMKRQLDEGVVSLRQTLQAQLEIATDRLNTVAYMKDDSREDAIKRGLDAQDYVDAKRDFETDRQKLQAMREMTELELGDLSKAIRDQEGKVEESRKQLASVVRTKGIIYKGQDSYYGQSGVDEDHGARSALDPSARDRTRANAISKEKPASEQTSGDRYGKFIDQPWKSPARDPLSTFSIDVDTASYGNVRRMIREGREIPEDAVRIEECINAFKYNYAQPKGDGPFAVGATLAACPWAPEHQLVRVAIKGREIETNKRPASNLVFLIDVSGSMQSPDKLPLLKQSMTTLVEQLDERDRVAIVVYAGSEGVALPSTRLDAEGRATVLKALAKLDPGGSTNGGAGIRRAYEIAMKEKIEGGVNRVILATDGDFNVGVTGQSSLVELVKDRAKGGVNLTVLGFGTGNLNDAMMDAITRDGNGNYFYIDSQREGTKVFLKNLTGTLVTIAKDVKIQVEFNPAKVGSYRLIGYSNRVLHNEDFSNDKVDAGDIGAGHTVTAFYELIPPGAADLKYQATDATDEWLTVKLRHKHPDGDESRLIEFPLTGEVPAIDKTDADFQFATAAALFGMKLRGMEEVRQIAWDKVLELARPGLADDASEDRAEFVELVKKLRDSITPAEDPNLRVIHHEDGSRTDFSLGTDSSTLTRKTFSPDGTLVMTAEYRMDAIGNPLGCKILDGQNQELAKVSYGYNRSGQLVEKHLFDVRVRRVDPETGKEFPVQKVTYPYDAEGKRGEPIVSNLLARKTVDEILGVKGGTLGMFPFEVVEMLRNGKGSGPRPRVVPPPAGEAEVMPTEREK
jgi:Ca-activated chloride channel family protein